MMATFSFGENGDECVCVCSCVITSVCVCVCCPYMFVSNAG